MKKKDKKVNVISRDSVDSSDGFWRKWEIVCKYKSREIGIGGQIPPWYWKKHLKLVPYKRSKIKNSVKKISKNI
jgi:hypothetical protein